MVACRIHTNTDADPNEKHWHIVYEYVNTCKTNLQMLTQTKAEIWLET